MASVFTQIIEGSLPGHFVWRDELAVGFLSIAPLNRGHTLVVPRAEVDHWLDLEPELVAHLFSVAQSVGRAIQAAYQPEKVGMVVLGLEVPHVHIHVAPIWGPTDLDFHNADPGVANEVLAAEAETLRAALGELGYSQASD
jgi:diadenosine tetraphosphate (Ap4A) HIT family hydrolase